MSIFNEKVLVLNKQWNPISLLTLKNALRIVSKNHGVIVEPITWAIFKWDIWINKALPITDERKINDRYYIKTINKLIPIPEIILLSNYNKTPPFNSNITRIALYERDDYKCQYCGAQLSKKQELTIDHIIPISKGGKTSWDNCVVACIKCNQIKSNKLLSECGMKLISKPSKPNKNQIIIKPKAIKDSWKQLLNKNDFYGN